MLLRKRKQSQQQAQQEPHEHQHEFVVEEETPLIKCSVCGRSLVVKRVYKCKTCHMIKEEERVQLSKYVELPIEEYVGFDLEPKMVILCENCRKLLEDKTSEVISKLKQIIPSPLEKDSDAGISFENFRKVSIKSTEKFLETIQKLVEKGYCTAIIWNSYSAGGFCLYDVAIIDNKWYDVAGLAIVVAFIDGDVPIIMLPISAIIQELKEQVRQRERTGAN